MNENTGTTLNDEAKGKDATFGSGSNSPGWSQTVFPPFSSIFIKLELRCFLDKSESIHYNPNLYDANF